MELLRLILAPVADFCYRHEEAGGKRLYLRSPASAAASLLSNLRGAAVEMFLLHCMPAYV